MMNTTQIEEHTKALLAGLLEGSIEKDAFIYEMLLAYDHRKQSVTRLRSGERNLSSKGNTPRHDEIIWKRHLYFRQVKGNALHAEIDHMRKEKLVTTNKIRFVIVTNFDQLLAVDTKTFDSLDINLDELPKQFDFFLPWAGMEKAVYQGENPADVKAAEKMAKLFDLIKGDNFDESKRDDTEALHNLNVFLTRLLFCFFAEDTEIFSDKQFSWAIQSHTKDDGSDLSGYLNRLFTVLNTADGDRGELPDYLANFPYVNGGLFTNDIPSLAFSAKSRRMLIECGSELNWSDINPDIFGSMIQAVVHPDQRGGMGMHYTSVTNIMKVIEPLFLNDLYEELEKAESSATKLQKFQQRLGKIKIFDPACGSGNFLIIAYKELRKLEIEILKKLQELELEKTGQISQPFSVIKLSQFYGVELDDFAHEVAILSLWLAEHQMNVEFKVEFGSASPSLPLPVSGNITCGNATNLNWFDLCPTGDSDELYLLGNPPYLGARMQDKQQKKEIQEIYSQYGKARKVDYIFCWIIKASEFIIGKNHQFAFVSTNSICQGEQIPLLWPIIISNGQELCFAYRSFKWQNNAKSNAGVYCVIVGIRNKSSKPKYIYDSGLKKEVGNISGYLTNTKDVYIERKSSPISSIPEMKYGNMAIDGGNLILSQAEKDALIKQYPESESLVRKVLGAQEFIRGVKRWCLWVEDKDVNLAFSIPPISQRINATRDFRLSSTDLGTHRLAEFPYQFREMNKALSHSILMPTVSSERREYVPVGYVDNMSVIIAPNNAIYDPELYVFGLISSRMHMVWIRATAGRLKTDIRYSSVLCYNTFPFADIDDAMKDHISRAGLSILSVRENHPSKSIAELYDPKKMPDDLKQAHFELDVLVDSCYRVEAFNNNNDDDRLAVLLEKFEKMTGDISA